MSACHVLLWRPWKFERGFIHDGRKNIIIVEKDGRMFVLIPKSFSYDHLLTCWFPMWFFIWCMEFCFCEVHLFPWGFMDLYMVSWVMWEPIYKVTYVLIMYYLFIHLSLWINPILYNMFPVLDNLNSSWHVCPNGYICNVVVSCRASW